MELYDFQEEAVNFFIDKKSVLLGDDMGLGKTAQAVVLDYRRRVKQPNLEEHPKTLVITYLGIFSSWIQHYRDWAPELRVCVINNKNRKPFLDSIENNEHDIYIMHWQGLRLVADILKQTKWFHIIADEAHALQDRKSKQSVSLKTLKTWYKSALSGTPAYDKPDDLWSPLNWLYPDYWRSYWKYYNEHIIFTDFNGYRTIVGVNNVEKLQREMSSFYVRRLKHEVIHDLPEKYYDKRIIRLHPKQERIYEQMRRDMLAWVGEHENEPVSAPIVVAQLTRLQQFAAAYGELDLSGKLVLSEPSAKLDALMDIIKNTDQQIVVFSQFAAVMKLLRTRLEKGNISHGIFIGDTSSEDRRSIIENFQAGKLQVFAGTIAAGGIGITLTAASTAVFLDRAWSASLNIQAEDRLHRIGQKNAVQIIDLISEGTIEARRLDKIQLQWSWIKKLLGEDED